jgi:hypothetical protein
MCLITAITRQPKCRQVPDSRKQRRGKPTHDTVAALAVIGVKLTGSDTASAEGITVTGATPVLALCRKLIVYGFDPAIPIHVFRGDTLALRVRAIGEAAALSIKPTGVGFGPFRAGPQGRSSSPSIAPNVPARSRQRKAA